ncbi:ATP-binding protein [Nannocystis sp. SCPEA4]|uniref:sensor histidine kinase n=1 Tax=Nannocystis sp. SCPEA4 TaxID=2996787 RepID=UPI0022721C5E|nr:ATP-binding protein [Nannocystis sp. SCPEA4]
MSPPDPPGIGEVDSGLADENARLRAELAELRRTREQETRDLSQAQSLLQAIAEHAPIVIYAKDTGGRFILSNQRHAALLDRSPFEVLGKREQDLIAPEAAAEIDAGTAVAIHERRIVTSEVTIPLRDGEHTFWESVFPLIDRDGHCYGLGGIATDVSERKRMEFEQRRTRDALLQREKMAALGGLVAGVAHEINTPLGVALTAVTHGQQILKRLADEVERGTLTRGELRRALADLRDSCALTVDNLRRGAHLITSFKKVAVDQSSEAVRRVALCEWLQDVVASLRPMLRAARVEHEIRCAPGPTLELAVGALTQVVTNLVQNACVHAFAPEQHERRLVLGARVGGDSLQLECADNGRGIAHEHVSRVFEPFFTTRRGEGGSGLGMHIVHNIVVERFGGRIELDPTHAGTRWTIELPLGTPAIRRVEE